ncbi:hypothetical protein DICPUDRAFT_80902 [Dictyostelium purpureum]|uniref:Uncharacterized protein n=1 Tax=Dictyostelium purpureum TaxID=5786 RepID=F0ZRW0_DICPU|nr:uncharacterized protein DICPUDRAFT_80902 [Dictyostelium purpureum]EGC33338.1 hypothetical protein DICPUDRAFT_80902 [Dictyostelium purpureum]|eukprot:XP_003290154.1 hypothetical protein DICPUDRAFT_80902 [Dictyostelium purpureum]
MKVLYLLVITSLIKIVSSTLWVNFIPYDPLSQCKSEIYGLGYSFAVGECFTLDYVNYWYFEAFEDLTVQWDSFIPPFGGGPGSCQQATHQTPRIVKDGQCLDTIEDNFNLNLVPAGNHSFQVVVSNTPAYTKFDYVNTFEYGPHCSKNSNNALFATFASNGTLILPNLNPNNPTNDIEQSIFCIDNKPTMYHCVFEKNNQYNCSYESTAADCRQQKPFIAPSSTSQDSSAETDTNSFYSSTSCFGGPL